MRLDVGAVSASIAFHPMGAVGARVNHMGSSVMGARACAGSRIVMPAHDGYGAVRPHASASRGVDRADRKQHRQ